MWLARGFPGGEGAFVLYPLALSTPGGWQCPSSPVVQTGYPGALLKLQGQGHEGSVGGGGMGGGGPGRELV